MVTTHSYEPFEAISLAPLRGIPFNRPWTPWKSQGEGSKRASGDSGCSGRPSQTCDDLLAMAPQL